MNNLPQEAEILLYSTDDGTVKIDVLAQDDTLWLTQKKMAELFQVKTGPVHFSVYSLD